MELANKLRIVSIASAHFIIMDQTVKHVSSLNYTKLK